MVAVTCRAENSFTHRHLCEFTGLDFEMAINEHYNEVMDVIDRLFVYIFNGLNAKYGQLRDALCLCSVAVLLARGGLLSVSLGLLWLVLANCFAMAQHLCDAFILTGNLIPGSAL